jgi:hypothetical protein
LNTGNIEIRTSWFNSGRIDNNASGFLGSSIFPAGLFIRPGGLLWNFDRLGLEGAVNNFGNLSAEGSLANQAAAGIVNWGEIEGEILDDGPLLNCPFSLVESATNVLQAERCEGSGDRDEDGLSDEIDQDSSRFSDGFDDFALAETPPVEEQRFTRGFVRRRGDQQLWIRKLLRDEPGLEPIRWGIDLEALPGGGPLLALIRACGQGLSQGTDFALDSGDSLRITCGSTETQVLAGPVDHTFYADDGRTFFASIDSGHTLTFEPETASFTADSDNPGPILIETEGVEFEVGAGGTVEAPLLIAIDVKPGGEPNTLPCHPAQLVPVAILTTDSFDATTVDHTTVHFAGASEVHLDREGAPHRHDEEDVDEDGDIDLAFHFLLGDTGLACNATSATLLGETFDGVPSGGTDSIRLLEGTRRCGLGFELAMWLPGLAWLARKRCFDAAQPPGARRRAETSTRSRPAASSSSSKRGSSR